MCPLLPVVHGGRGRAGAGRRGEDGVDIYILILYGGRGRAGAGRREKTGNLTGCL